MDDRRAQWSRLAEDLSIASFWGVCSPILGTPIAPGAKGKRLKQEQTIEPTDSAVSISPSYWSVMPLSAGILANGMASKAHWCVRPVSVSDLQQSMSHRYRSSIPRQPPFPAIDCCNIIIDDSPAMLSEVKTARLALHVITQSLSTWPSLSRAS